MYNILNDQDNLEITSYINQYRKLHNSPDLELDSKISKIAQLSAIKLIKNKKIDNYDENYSYNISLSIKSKNEKIKNIKRVIDLWYKQKKNYLNDDLDNSKNFTSLIWKSSTKFGLGYAYVNGKSTVCILLNEKGNILDLYDDNVEVYEE